MVGLAMRKDRQIRTKIYKSLNKGSALNIADILPPNQKVANKERKTQHRSRKTSKDKDICEGDPNTIRNRPGRVRG